MCLFCKSLLTRYEVIQTNYKQYGSKVLVHIPGIMSDVVNFCRFPGFLPIMRPMEEPTFPSESVRCVLVFDPAMVWCPVVLSSSSTTGTDTGST